MKTWTMFTDSISLLFMTIVLQPQLGRKDIFDRRLQWRDP
jgi:hypothetical protein